MDKTFPIKGRYIVAIWLIPFGFFPGVNYLYENLAPNGNWYWFDIIYAYYYHSLFSILLVGLFVYYNVNWKSMLREPESKDYSPAIKLTIFIIIFSIASSYAFFYPLSFLWPSFVNYWFIDIPSFIYSSNQQFPIFPNILSFISLVVLAPIIEEFAFRGVLLHRWSKKWGRSNAILISSLLFGVVHPDSIGAFAFGIAMCVIYLKTQTLIVPIVCHAITNIIAWLFEVGYIIKYGANFVYTLETFYDEWMVGMIATVIASIWVYIYSNSIKSKKIWQLPKI